MFSDMQRDALRAMVHAHRENPEGRFILMYTDQGAYVSHTGLHLDSAIPEQELQALARAGLVTIEKSDLTLTDKAYEAVDSDFTIELEMPAEVEPAVDGDLHDHVDLASLPQVDHDELAAAIASLIDQLDMPDPQPGPMFGTLAQIFGLLAEHPGYAHTPAVQETVLDTLGALEMLHD
ncbi:MAG: hypothetical protein GYB64_13615 [Chloroflexi bacterium]|nr:hypothetical protein [Chloroflexota bacterium]